MSVVLASQTLASTPTTSLQAALKHFENELTKEQKANLFQSNHTLTPSDVVVFIAEIDAANQSSRRSVSSRLFTFLDTAQQFASVVDTFVSANPNVAALVWGGIKASLIIANNNLQYFDKVTVMITDIGKLSPTYSEYGRLYQDDQSVQTALCDYYAVIVRICTAVVQLYSRPSLASRFLSFEAHFKPLLDELERAQKRLVVCFHLASQKLMNNSVTNIEREHKASRFYRQATARFQKTSHQQQIKIRAALANQYHQQILDNFSEVNTRQIWSMVHAQRVSGTAEWFVQDPAFESWFQSSQSSILWCSGNMGVGKSVVVSSIVAHLEQSLSTKSCIAYHFCRTGHENTLTARGVLGAISRQLLATSITSLNDTALQVMFEKSNSIVADEFAELLKLHLAPRSQKSYLIVLDGLDECSEPDAALILRQLQPILDDSKFCVRLLYSCRPDLEYAISTIWKYNLRLAITKEKIRPDIETYIEQMLERCVVEEKLSVRDPKLILRIAKVLEDNHNGMFLWLSLFIEELCEHNSEADIDFALEHPPVGIKELYSRKLSRIRSSNLSRYCLDILRFTGVACRPLTLEEMREALSVRLDQQDFDTRSLPYNMNRIVKTCSGLILIDEGTETLSYVHASLLQHLFLDQIEGDFDLQVANLHFSSVCLTYFNYRNFSKQIITAPKERPKIGPLDMALAQVESSLPLSSQLIRMLLGYRKYKSTTDLQPLYDLLPRDSSHGTLHFNFFRYVRRNWLQQIKGVDPAEESDFWKKLNHCVKNESLNEWKPWMNIEEGPIPHLSDADRATKWSITNNHETLLFHQAIFETFDTFDMNESLWKLVIDRAVGPVSDLVAVAFRKWLKAKGMRSRAIDRLIQVENKEANATGDWPGLGDTDGEAGETFAALERRLLQKAPHYGLIETMKLLIAIGADINTSLTSDQTPLHIACKSGHYDITKLLLQAGANVDAVDEHGMTPLYLACQGGYLEIAVLLLRCGANANAVAMKLEWTPLHIVCYMGRNVELVDLLVNAGANINATDKDNRTPLYVACTHGHLSIVQQLLSTRTEIDAATINGGSDAFMVACSKGRFDIAKAWLMAGVDVNSTDEDGRTALWLACSRGQIIMPEKLVNAGADVNATDKDKCTPLHVVCKDGHLEAVKLLLKAGANFNTSDRDDWTPLHYACLDGHLEIAKLLLRAGADISANDKDGSTPLHHSCENGHLEVAKLLLEAGANINAGDEQIWTPLHHACVRGQVETVEHLLAAGANVNATNKYKRAALHWACLSGYSEIVRILLTWGADVNAITDDEWTPLHHACYDGHIETAKILLEAGASINAVTGEESRTPLHFACYCKSFEITVLLISGGAEVNAIDNHTQTPLHIACETGDLMSTNLLLEAGADSGFINNDGQSAMDLATKNRHEHIKYLLQQHQSQNDQKS